MLAGPGRVGQIGAGARRITTIAADFTISASTVATQWGPAVTVGSFTPLNTSGDVFFELVSEDAGLGVSNG